MADGPRSSAGPRLTTSRRPDDAARVVRLASRQPRNRHRSRLEASRGTLDLRTRGVRRRRSPHPPIPPVPGLLRGMVEAIPEGRTMTALDRPGLEGLDG